MEISEDRRQTMLVTAAFLALICFFSSFLLFAYALHIKVTVDSRMALIETYNSDVLPGIFVAVGIVNLIQNISAIYILLRLRDPEVREDQLRFLMAVLVGGIILVLFEVTSAIVSFVHIGILDDEFKKGIVKAMEEYVAGEELKKEIDGVQMDYSCCGDKAYTDWFQYSWLATDLVRVVPGSLRKYTQDGDNYFADDVPFSCCDLKSPRPCIHHHIHDDTLHFSYNHQRETTLYVTGCRHVLMDIYGTILLAVGWVALAIAAVKTCVLLMVRLLQTSLYRAEELEDWEATTTGYIYYDNPEDEDEEADENEDTGEETEEEPGPETDREYAEEGEERRAERAMSDEEANENANTTFESNFSKNAASGTDSSDSDSDDSSSSSSSSGSSSSSSWEDLSATSTDSEESTHGAAAATAAVKRISSPHMKNSKHSAVLSKGRHSVRLAAQKKQSPVKFEVDRIEPAEPSVRGIRGTAAFPTNPSEFESFLRDPNVKRESDRRARGDNPTKFNVSNDIYTSRSMQPTQLRQRQRRGDEEFMDNGPLSHFRRRSAAHLDDEPRGSLMDGTDQGLLSRIKAHLTGTQPAESRRGFGGMFAPGYRYSRLSTTDNGLQDKGNKNINAGPFSRRRKGKHNKDSGIGNYDNEHEKLPAQNQTVDFVDESVDHDPTLYNHDVNVDCVGLRQSGFSSPKSPTPPHYRRGRKQAQAGVPSLNIQSHHSTSCGQNDEAVDTAECSEALAKVTQHGHTDSSRVSYVQTCQEYALDITPSGPGPEQCSLPHTSQQHCLKISISRQPKQAQLKCGQTKVYVHDQDKNKNITPLHDLSESVPSIDRLNFNETQIDPPQAKQNSSSNKDVYKSSYSIPLTLRNVWFDVASEDEKPASNLSARRGGTPYPNVTSESDYDLIPTSIRPNHLTSRGKVGYTDSPSDGMASVSALDNEVAEIISGSNSVASHVKNVNSKVSPQTSGTVQSAIGVVGHGATLTCLHVGSSPIKGAHSTNNDALPKPDIKFTKTLSVMSSTWGTQRDSSDLFGYEHKTQLSTPSPLDQVCEQSPSGRSPGSTGGSPGRRSHIRSCWRRSASNSMSRLRSETNQQSPMVKTNSEAQNITSENLRLPHNIKTYVTKPRSNSAVGKTETNEAASDEILQKIVRPPSFQNTFTSFTPRQAAIPCPPRLSADDKHPEMSFVTPESGSHSRSTSRVLISHQDSPQAHPNKTHAADGFNTISNAGYKENSSSSDGLDLLGLQTQEYTFSETSNSQKQSKSPERQGLLSPFY